ncbi:hypothetical protein Cenrod_0366 [Candidatus Symbiobacter mobilis CR]|uniref:Uncharacterized protein n=2 Tax=Candidatus Symbiobacter TaxID=1436289 RepID=U5N8I2_9BURK|nr:hypothetical protein Cenrod_0366 [Candidatus Symbiobacter mobilis CR]
MGHSAVQGALARGLRWLLPVGMAVGYASGVMAGEIYTCIDGQGRKLTSDRPIKECRDREQLMLNPSGTVKARIGPVLTERELGLLEAQRRREKAEQDRLLEEKKRDRALLARYPTPELHSKDRAAALANIDRIKQIAARRIAELKKDRQKLLAEADFYKQDRSKMPAKLSHQIDEVGQALAAQDRFLAEQNAEAERINKRFDEEFARLTPLWRMAAEAYIPSDAPAEDLPPPITE